MLKIPGAKSSLAVLIILFLFSFFIAVPLRMYQTIPPLDIILHFLGGLFVAFMALSYYNSEFKKLSQPFRFFTMMGIVLGIAVFWEFFEYILRMYFSDYASDLLGHRVDFQGDLNDTMQDFLIGSLGGMFAALSSNASESKK